GLLAGGALLAAAGGDDRAGSACSPQALGLALGVLVLLEARVEPAPGVFAGFRGEARVNLPVIARGEWTDLVFGLDQDGVRVRIHSVARSACNASLRR